MTHARVDVVFSVDQSLVDLVGDILARVDEILQANSDKAAEVALTSTVESQTTKLAAAVAANPLPQP